MALQAAEFQAGERMGARAENDLIPAPRGGEGGVDGA